MGFGKIKILHLSFLLFFLLGLPSAKADLTCSMIINPEPTFNKVLEAAVDYDKASLLPNPAYLESAMTQLGLTSNTEKEIFNKAMKLKPILDSEILYEAIAAQALILGFKGKSEVEKLLNNFNFLDSRKKQIVIDGILQNILSALGEEIDFNNIDHLQVLAKRYHTTEANIVSITRTFAPLSLNGFEEAKIVILDLLRTPTATLISETTSFQKNFSRSINPFKKTQSLPVQFKTEAGFGSALAMNQYLQSSNTRMKVYFLKQNLDQLKVEQLIKVKKDKTWSLLPESLRTEIESRLPEVDDTEQAQMPIQNALEMNELSKKSREMAIALRRTSSPHKAEEFIRHGTELAQTPEDFIDIFSGGASESFSDNKKELRYRSVLTYLDRFFALHPSSQHIISLITESGFEYTAKGYDTIEQIFIRAGLWVSSSTQYRSLFTTATRASEKLEIRRAKVCKDTLAHFFSLKPESAEVRKLMIDGRFLESSEIDEEILQKGAFSAKTIQDYLLIFDDVPLRSANRVFQSARELALKATLNHFFELNPSDIEVDELIVRTNFSQELNEFILKKRAAHTQ